MPPRQLAQCGPHSTNGLSALSLYLKDSCSIQDGGSYLRGSGFETCPRLLMGNGVIGIPQAFEALRCASESRFPSHAFVAPADRASPW
jgi:hypothetical protein